MHRETFLTALVMLLSTLFTLAYGQQTISGKVIEMGSGESLPFATIQIENSGIGTTTNVDGFFSLINIPSKEVTLLISYVGYETKRLDIKELNTKELLIIKLSPLSQTLEEVIISGESNKILDAVSGISTTRLSTKQLSLLPSIGETDIFRSLQLLPGVSGTNESSSGLYVRGGTPDQNLVLLDGMTVYKVDHFFGFFSAFNANAVKDVQLYKGAFPSRYGGRTSSVVDLTGKTGSFEKFQGGANLNLLSINAYVEGPISEKFSFFLAGRRSYTDVIQSGIFKDISDQLISDNNFGNGNIDPSNITTVTPDFYFYDWNGKLSFKPTQKDMVTLSFYSGRDFLDESRIVKRKVIPTQPDSPDVFFQLDEKTDWGNTGASLKWSRQWNPKLYSKFLIAGSEYFSEYARDAFLEITTTDPDSTLFTFSQQTFEDNSVQDLSIQSDFEWQQSMNTKIEFGLTYTQTEISYQNVRDDSISILERDQEASYGSFYVSGESKIGSKLTFTAGFRFSKYEYEEDILFEPRLNLKYKITDKLTFKAAFGKHYQFVNRIINENITEGSRDFWLLADNDLVKLSSALHYVVGFSYEVDNWLFDVEGYYKDLTGLSEFSLRFRRGPEINVDELFFTGNGIAHGIEFLLQKKQGKYTGWASYTLGKVRNTFDVFNNGNEFPALHDQLHEFKMVHSIEIEDWTLSSTFIFGSGKPFSEPDGQYTVELLDGKTFNYIGIGAKNGSRLPAYNRLDISAHYKFEIKKGKAKGDLGLSIFNLYGRQNVWYIEYDFNQEPVLVSEVNYLGFTPNVSLSIQF